jgi:hypothetical protein
MGEMTPKQIIGLVAAVSLTAALVVPLLRSNDRVDCSSLKPWSSSHGSYRKDELVWVKVARYANGAEFSCSDAACDGEPQTSSQWTTVGECKHHTAPH